MKPFDLLNTIPLTRAKALLTPVNEQDLIKEQPIT